MKNGRTDDRETIIPRHYCVAGYKNYLFKFVILSGSSNIIWDTAMNVKLNLSGKVTQENPFNPCHAK